MCVEMDVMRINR